MPARAGLFGKLPARRDFVSVGVPRAFVAAWDPWLQRGLAAGRDAFGGAWLDAYMSAPIWRFWLGADLCGVRVLGALMASVDGAGRCFPLTLAFCGARGAAHPMPDRAPESGWFAAVESLLLASLDEDASLEAAVDALGRLPEPSREPAPGAGAADTASLWWTVGGPGVAARSFAAGALPAAAELGAMLGPPCAASAMEEVGLGR